MCKLVSGISFVIMISSAMITSGLLAQDATLTKRDIVVIEESYKLWQLFGEEIWVGWTEIEMPMIFVKEKAEFGFGFHDPPKGFVKTDKQIAGMTVYSRKRVFDVKFAASFPVDGEPCIVIGTPESLEQSPVRWVLTATHEMFHVLQMNRGSMAKISSLGIVEGETDGSWQLNFPFPYDNTNIMRLFHLEGYPLFLAVTNTGATPDVKYNVGVSVDARNVLRDLLVSQTKSDAAFNYARFQEWSEGIARYTEYRLAELAAEKDYQPSSEFHALEGYVPFPVVWREQFEGQVNLIKHAGRVARSRTEFYNIGMAKGLALDRLEFAWRDSYFAPGVWLDDLLAQAVGTSTTLEAIQIGEQLPDFELATISGDSVHLSSNGQKSTLIYFWQPWCPPCIESFPKLRELSAQFAPNLQIVGIVDRCQDIVSAKAILEQHEVEFPIALDDTGDVARNCGIEGYPHLFVLDNDRIVRWQKSGKLAPEQFEEIRNLVSDIVSKSESGENK